VNPHARLMVDVDGEKLTFERVSADPIACPQAIQPHPHGIELGALKRMAEASPAPLGEFLVNSFSRVGKKAAADIGATAGLEPGRKVKALSAEELKRLHAALQSIEVPAPPAAQCLSPIGEELIRQGLAKEFQLDYVKARTRPPSVYSGHPFVVEAAIGYGGRLPAEDRALILRFANRVPLMYQPGACAITQAVSDVNWKQYGITQQGLPMGPLLVLVHVASTNVPFTSESKDAIAAIPEITKEIDLVLKDLGRELKQFLSRRDRRKAQDDRARAICSIIPEIAAKVSEIVEKPLIDTSPLEGKIMHRVVAKKWTADGNVYLSLRNYTDKEVTLSVYDLSPDEGAGVKPKPAYSDRAGDEYTRVWQVKLAPDGGWDASYRGKGGGRIDLRGVEDSQKVVVDLDV
jgi:DNA topoisomerase VI subunit B